jgi:hypothetical protein
VLGLGGHHHIAVGSCSWPNYRDRGNQSSAQSDSDPLSQIHNPTLTARGANSTNLIKPIEFQAVARGIVPDQAERMSVNQITITVEPLSYKDNRAFKNIDQGPGYICILNNDISESRIATGRQKLQVLSLPKTSSRKY